MKSTEILCFYPSSAHPIASNPVYIVSITSNMAQPSIYTRLVSESGSGEFSVSRLIPKACIDAVLERQADESVAPYVKSLKALRAKCSRGAHLISYHCKDYSAFASEVDGYHGATAIGRLGVRGVDIRGFNHPVRDTLLGHGMMGFDISCANPTFLYHFFSHLGLHHLREYVTDRDSVMRRFDVEHRFVKSAVNACINNPGRKVFGLSKFNLEGAELQRVSHALNQNRYIREIMGYIYIYIHLYILRYIIYT